MPTSQKAEVRPISFVLHDQSVNAAPVTFPLVIRPEDLSRSDESRLTVHQTLGGAWGDNFGPGLATITLAGHTGWGAAGRPDGLDQFQQLYDNVFRKWHALREAAAQKGNNPDLVRLIFADALDGFTYVVAPRGFVLKRNKSRPLLSQYQITLIKLGDALPVSKDGKPAAGILDGLGLNSLGASLQTIQDFVKGIGTAIQKVLGPITATLKDFVSKTAGILTAVKTVISQGISATFGPLLEVAKLATQAAHNVMCIVSSITSLPALIKANVMQVTGAFRNAFCLLANVFKPRRAFPDYSSVYGSSNCSSTAGGSPISPYGNVNTWQQIFTGSAGNSAVAVSSDGRSALSALASTDVTRGTIGAAAPLMAKAMSGLQVA